MSEDGGERFPAGHRARHIRFSPARLATASVLLLMIALLVLVVVRLVRPAEWEFGLEVSTEVAVLELQPDTLTRWRIDGAVICARQTLELPVSSKLDAGSGCGGRSWQGWQVALPEVVLTVRGGTKAVLEASGARLAISLRAGDGGSVGTLEVVGAVPELDVGSALNLFWDSRTETALSFPFNASTTLGRAVSWSDPRMLRSGSVAVYTADDSADRRTQVDQAALMLGDQVSLSGDPDGVWPKGFVRPEAGYDSLVVVAFGRADSLSIVRYGDSGYDFRPGVLARLASDPTVTFWGSLLLVYVSLILTLVPFLESRSVHRERIPHRYRYVRWLMREDDG